MAVARAARATVYWPVGSSLPESMTEVYPRTLPPLRSDRDSILIGVLKDREAQEVEISLEANGKTVGTVKNEFSPVLLVSTKPA